MNRKTPALAAPLAAAGLALAALAALPARAAEAEPEHWTEVAGSMSRGQVLAELAQARRDGTINASSREYDFVSRAGHALSREQVRQELLHALANHEPTELNND